MNARPGVSLISSLAVVAAWIAGCSVAFDPSSTSSSSAGGGSASSTGAGGGFTSAGTGTTTTTGAGDGGITDWLGAPCAADTECGGALVCVTSTDDDPIFGGGPAGGLCTRACDADADCPGTHALCVGAGSGQAGRCMLACALGPALDGLQQPLDPSKCRGREDLRCGKVKGSSTACLPTCGSDAQCGPGRACDPRRAVCVSAPSTGLASGASCDPMQEPSACAGVCLHFQFGQTMCTSPCVLGGEGLGSNDCGGPAHGVCVFAPSDNGAGDFGFCSPSCGAQSDCQDPHFWCFSVPDYTASTGKGYCFGATPCPGGQGECVDAKKQPLPAICTETAFGSYCLDPAFPLDASGGAGGAGGAGAGGAGAGGGGGGI